MKKALILLIALSLLFLLAGCGSNPHDGSANGESGGIAFSLSWDTSSPISKVIMALPEGADVCTYYQIGTINATVANASGQTVATGSWPCSAHSGTIPNVPVGTMSVTIDGLVGTTVLWRGQATGIPVVKDQTANAGTIAMVYIGGDHTAPTVQSGSVNPANGATGVSLSASVSAIFSEPVVTASVNTSTFTLTCGTITVTGAVAYDSATRTATFDPTLCYLHPQHVLQPSLPVWRISREITWLRIIHGVSQRALRRLPQGYGMSPHGTMPCGVRKIDQAR